MKRSTVIRKIVKTLQFWENSKLDRKCANAVLTLLEKEGIITPPEVVVWKTKVNGKVTPVFGMEWESERPRPRKKVKKDIIYGKVGLDPKVYNKKSNHKFPKKKT